MATSDGLIFGLRVLSDGRVESVAWSDVTERPPEDGLLWLHLDAEADEARRWIREASGLDPVTQEALLAEETRPREAAIGDALLLILRGVNLTPGEEPDDMVSLRVFVERTRLLTLRRRPVRTVEEVRQSLEAGRLTGAPGDLLVAICDRVTTRVGEVVEDVEDRTDDLEEQVLTVGSRELRARISDLRRTMIALRRYLAPQREAIARAVTEPLSWLDERHRARLREIADRCIRHVEELDAAREHAGVAHEELASRLTERVEERMYLLSLVAAIFLPLGFLTGLLGINVGGIPGSDAPNAFLYVALICAGVVVGLLLWMRRRGWIGDRPRSDGGRPSDTERP